MPQKHRRVNFLVNSGGVKLYGSLGTEGQELFDSLASVAEMDSLPAESKRQLIRALLRPPGDNVVVYVNGFNARISRASERELAA